MANSTITFTENTDLSLVEREDRNFMPFGIYMAGWGAGSAARGVGALAGNTRRAAMAHRLGYSSPFQGSARRLGTTVLRSYMERDLGTGAAGAFFEDFNLVGRRGGELKLQRYPHTLKDARRVGLGMKRKLNVGALRKKGESAIGHTYAKYAIERSGGAKAASSIATNKAQRAAIKRFVMGQKAMAIGLTGAKIAGAMSSFFWWPLKAKAVKAIGDTLGRVGREARRLNFGGEFMDSAGSYTERQRSLRAITSSRMSARAAIGGEAQLFHR
jgi:hypothetical protein